MRSLEFARDAQALFDRRRDHLLRDLGLTRVDIERAVQQGRDVR